MQPSSPQNRHEHSMLSREPSFSQAMYRVSINKRTIVSAIPIYLVGNLKKTIVIVNMKKTSTRPEKLVFTRKFNVHQNIQPLEIHF